MKCFLGESRRPSPSRFGYNGGELGGKTELFGLEGFGKKNGEVKNVAPSAGEFVGEHVDVRSQAFEIPEGLLGGGGHLWRGWNVLGEGMRCE